MSFIEQVQKVRKRDYRDETGLTIVEGYPEVSRAVKAGVPVEQLYICPEIFQDEHEEFSKQSVTEISKDEFAQIAFGARLKGILAVCKPHQPQLTDLKLKANPCIMVVEGVEKPGNLGTVLRAADGAGLDAVIMCDSRTDIYNHNVVRSSIGTVFTIPAVAASKEDTYAFLKDHNIAIYAATAKADHVYSDCDYKKSSVFVVGNEHTGLSSFWLQQADQTIRIPMLGISGSLNVAMSASVLMYEALRQRNA